MSNTTMSFADATVAVLEAAQSPLHYRDITQQALDQALIHTDGKTPEATLNAILAVDIKQKGQESRFVRVKPWGFRATGMGANGNR
jgi:restriction system protein